MSTKQTIADLIAAWVGGAGLSLIGALTGRAMFHTLEVKRMNRKFFGKEMMWELPIVLGMGLIGDGAASYLALDQSVATALIAYAAYLGPRGFEVMLQRYFTKKFGKDTSDE